MPYRRKKKEREILKGKVKKKRFRKLLILSQAFISEFVTYHNQQEQLPSSTGNVCMKLREQLTLGNTYAVVPNQAYMYWGHTQRRQGRRVGRQMKLPSASHL